MPDKIRTMDLTKRDLKKLKFQKVVSGILFGLLSIVTLMMVSFGFVFVFLEDDGTAGMILAVGAIVIAILTFLIRKHYRSLKADLTGGVKEAVMGEIEDKMRHRSNCDFKINGVTYHVNMDAYQDHEIGDHVLIAFGPASKVMLNIQKIVTQE